MPTRVQPTKRNIVIVGAGFAGVRAARRLARHRAFDVTLVSPEPTFAYYPQLYHAATGGARSESALPLRDVLAGLPVRLVRDHIVSIDPEHRAVMSATTSYPYHELLLALGSVTNYFGIKGLPEFSYDIKSITGAERFKHHLHKELIDDRKADPNYVVVGGGPTGVELAAALGEYLHVITAKHGLAKPKYRIELVEAAPRLLPRSPAAMSARVERRLKKIGVIVLTGQAVQAETARSLKLAGQTLDTKTVVWTAGVSNNPFFAANAQHFTLAKNGKVQVNDHLQADPHIYVLGDNAATPYSGMAQTALADADFAVEDVLLEYHGHARPAYQPKAPITIIPAGGLWAATQWGWLRFYGFPGYVSRRVADLLGYADIESWPQAARVWLQDLRREDNCPICAKGAAS